MRAPNRMQPLPLTAIKALHTLVWAWFAGSIVALPLLAWAGRFGWALLLTALIVGECLVLGVNGGRCPLTDWAARFTDDRSHNFDIYLPQWLAKHNKTIFGVMFVINEMAVGWLWVARG